MVHFLSISDWSCIYARSLQDFRLDLRMVILAWISLGCEAKGYLWSYWPRPHARHQYARFETYPLKMRNYMEAVPVGYSTTAKMGWLQIRKS